MLWPEDPGRGKAQAPEGPITDVTVVSCKTGRALEHGCDFLWEASYVAFQDSEQLLVYFQKRQRAIFPFFTQQFLQNQALLKWYQKFQVFTCTIELSSGFREL